jgi:hypothetical protein
MITFGVVFAEGFVNNRKMRRSKYIFIAITLIFSLSSCRKIEHLPPVPKIEFTSFQTFDTIDILGNHAKGGRLKFYFEDGDGNIGLNAPGKNQSDTTNLFFSLYKKTGGLMLPAADNDPLKPSSYRVPYMERTGVNTILKGTISVTFLYLFYNPTDTIRYDFYLEDRDKNQSNVASTVEIAVSSNKLYLRQ